MEDFEFLLSHVCYNVLERNLPSIQFNDLWNEREGMEGGRERERERERERGGGGGEGGGREMLITIRSRDKDREDNLI